MEKEFRCKDMGMDCDFVVCAPTESELFEKAGEHAKDVHKMKGFSQEMMDKARAVVRDVDECESSEEESGTCVC